MNDSPAFRDIPCKVCKGTGKYRLRSIPTEIGEAQITVNEIPCFVCQGRKTIRFITKDYPGARSGAKMWCRVCAPKTALGHSEWSPPRADEDQAKVMDILEFGRVEDEEGSLVDLVCPDCGHTNVRVHKSDPMYQGLPLLSNRIPIWESTCSIQKDRLWICVHNNNKYILIPLDQRSGNYTKVSQAQLVDFLLGQKWIVRPDLKLGALSSLQRLVVFGE